MATTYNAGIVTAYGAAVRGGYTGTYEQYCKEQAHIGTNAQRAESAADRAESAAETADKVVITPKVRNGSAGNPANTIAVAANKILPVGTIKRLLLSTSVEIPDGYHYMWSFIAYTISSGDPSNPSTTDYVITSKDPYQSTDEPYVVLDLPEDSKGVAIWLYAKNNTSGDYYALRVETVGEQCLTVFTLNDSVEYDSLKNTLYTYLTRESFSYLASGGFFTFFIDSVFDKSGRCAWLPTGNICIKLPSSDVREFDTANVLDNLPSDDVYTDGLNTKWFYLRTGRALVYDVETDTIASVPINGKTPLSDKQYALIMFWYNQCVGGMLFLKFMEDAQQAKLDSSARSIEEIDKAQIIQGSYDYYGSVVESSKRIRTKTWVRVRNGDRIKFKRGDVIGGIFYGIFDKYKAFIKDASKWIDSDAVIDIDWDGYAIFIFRGRDTNANIDPDDYDCITEIIPEGYAYYTDINVIANNAQHVPGAASNPLTLLHFSDLHGDVAALNRIIDDSNNILNIDDVICTGDMVPNAAEEISSWWPKNIMTCIGNHDSASYSQSSGYDWTALSMADRDAYYIKPFESNWNIVHESGTSYYYKDYASKKVRLIVVDAMLYVNDSAESTIQTAWIEQLLNDAVTNDLHVIIAIHAPVNGSDVENCSFSRYGRTKMLSLSDCFTPQVIVDIVDTAISNGLKFIGYIVGHNHQDYVYKPTSTQIGFCITCAAVSQTAQWRDSDQHRNEYEDAYNLVVIDTTNTLVKIIRCGGANIDDHMRARKAICFNYTTGAKLAEIL